MSTRNENYVRTPEADALTKELEDVINPIFDKYKDKYSFEDMFYLVSDVVHRKIIQEVMHRRANVNKIKKEK